MLPITFIDWLAGLYTNHANTESLPGKQTAPIEPTPNEFHLPTPAELAGKRDQLRGEITELEARIARLQTMLNENSGIRPDVEAAIRRDSEAVAAASHQLGEVLFAVESGFLSAAAEHNQPLEMQREELRRQMRALDEEFRKAANSDASLWSLYDFHMGINGRGGQNGDIGNSIPETPVTAEQQNAIVELYGSLFGSLSPGKQLGAVFRFHQFWLMHQRLNALENAMLTRDKYQADDSQLPISDTGPYLVLMDDGSVKTTNFSDLDQAIAAYYRRKLITMVSVDVAEARDQDMIDYLANRAGTMLRLVLAMEASLVPGVGEGMDIYTLGDSEASWWAKGFAGGSLLLSVLTGGMSPNAGALLRGGDGAIGSVSRISNFADAAEFRAAIRGMTPAAKVPGADLIIAKYLAEHHDGYLFNVRIVNTMEGSGKLFRKGVTVYEDGRWVIVLNGRLPLDTLKTTALHEATHVLQAITDQWGWFKAVHSKWLQWIPGTTYKHFVYEWEAYGVSRQGIDRLRMVVLGVWHDGRISVITDAIYVGGTVWFFWPSKKE